MEVYRIRHNPSGLYLITRRFTNHWELDIEGKVFTSSAHARAVLYFLTEGKIFLKDDDNVNVDIKEIEFEIIEFKLVEVTNTVAQGHMADVFSHKMFELGFHSDI